MKKATRIIGIIAGVIIVIVVIAVLASPSEPEEPFSEQPLTAMTVRDALDHLSGTSVELGDSITDIEVLAHAGTSNPNDFVVHVYFKPDSVWDEAAAMRIAVHTSIKAMETLFQNEAVAEVVMWEQLEFTDQYGSTEIETAIRIVMDKATADQVADWEVVDDRAWADHTTFFDLAELQYVHPAIAAEL